MRWVQPCRTERALRTSLPSALLILAALLLPACGQRLTESQLNESLERGWRAFSTGDFDVAVAAFDAVEKAPGALGEARYSALLGLASAWQLRPNPELARARDCYGRLDALGTEQARKQGMLGLALVDLAEGRTAEGQSRLTDLVRKFPESPEADEASIHLAESLLEPRASASSPAGFGLPAEAPVERGLRVLEERLQAFPHNPLATAMHIMLANQYIKLQRFPEAVKHLIAADEEGIAVRTSRAITRWRIARIAEKELGDYALAEKYYQRYVDEFQRTVLYYRALTSLERVRQARRGAQEAQTQ